MKLFLTFIFSSLFLCAYNQESDTINFSQKNLTEAINTDTVLIRIVGQICNDPNEILVQNNLPPEPFDFASIIISIVSLVSIIVGFLLNVWFEKTKSKKGIKEDGALWIVNFIQLKDALTDQISYLNEHLPEDKIGNYLFEDLTTVLRLNCKVFNKLDEKSVISYIKSENKSVSLKESIVLSGKITNSIQLIELTNQGLKNDGDRLLTSSNSIMTSYQVNFAKFNKASWKFLLDRENTYPNESNEKIAYNKIKELMEKYIMPNLDDGNFDLFALRDTFIEPFIRATFEIREDASVIKMNDLINLIDKDIKKLKMERFYYYTKLNKRKIAFSKSLDSVSSLLIDSSFPEL